MIYSLDEIVEVQLPDILDLLLFEPAELRCFIASFRVGRILRAVAELHGLFASFIFELLNERCTLVEADDGHRRQVHHAIGQFLFREERLVRTAGE